MKNKMLSKMFGPSKKTAEDMASKKKPMMNMKMKDKKK